MTADGNTTIRQPSFKVPPQLTVTTENAGSTE
jgi:hypothetical protein